MTTLALPQHLLALSRANETRLGRANVKRDVADGTVRAADVILNPPACTLTMTVVELLSSQRRWGGYRAVKFLAGESMSELKTVGSLTERQRFLLAGMLG